MEVLPAWFIPTLLFVLGTIVGSFLDVVTSRMHTGKSINDRSRCFSCGHVLSWTELVPLFSFIFQKGRCTACDAKIPIRLPFMELLTGLTFLLLYLNVSGYVHLGFSIILFCVLIVTALYDVWHMVIPNELVIVVLALAFVFLGLSYGFSFDIWLYVPHVIAAFLGALFFWFLWFISKGRWIGFGDAKLAFPLSLIVGYPDVISLVVLSFWIGAVISVGLIVGQNVWVNKKTYASAFANTLTMTNKVKGNRSRLSFPSTDVAKYQRYFTIKSEVPFAPFLILAFVSVYLFDLNVLELMAGFF